MEQNKKTPQVRFKGYNDAWEQRKLGEVAEKVYGGGTPKTSEEEFWGGNIPWFQSADLHEHEVQLAIPKKAITTLGLQKSAAQLVPGNSIAIVTRVGVGKLVFMPFSYATSQDFLSLSELNIDGKFGCYAIYRLLQREKNLTQGTSIKGITKDEILQKKIVVPNKIEQKKIGDYFTGLDTLITLHQRKYDKLINVKKAMLEKMFPKNGSLYPEIRFEGFTDAWEQRKLGEVANYRRGSFPQPYGKSEWYDGEEAMPFVQVADVTDTMKLVDDTKQKISKLAQPMSVYAEENSVLVTLQGSIGRVAITQYGAFVDRTVLIFEKYKTEIDNTFWAYIIKQKFIDEARKAPGGTIKTITKETLSDFDLSIPKYEEQKKIGAYFEHLDRLITLHQCKLEKLKNMKKSCLEKMFV